tara:strand:+ start:146 stop:283 length:138 start_codon:yes stop_codon:yes gene_type:complete
MSVLNYEIMGVFGKHQKGSDEKIDDGLNEAAEGMVEMENGENKES